MPAFIEIRTANGTSGVIVPYIHTMWSQIPDRASRTIPPLTDANQAYYWTRVWQEGERETLAELSRGNGKTFDSGKEAIAWLLDHSAD